MRKTNYGTCIVYSKLPPPPLRTDVFAFVTEPWRLSSLSTGATRPTPPQKSRRVGKTTLASVRFKHCRRQSVGGGVYCTFYQKEFQAFDIENRNFQKFFLREECVGNRKTAPQQIFFISCKKVPKDMYIQKFFFKLKK